MSRWWMAVVCLITFFSGNTLASSYWPGGYWYGGGGYSPGYYKPGYYPSYGYNYYEYPTFIKFRAVIPLVEYPTYGAYVQQAPPSTPCQEQNKVMPGSPVPSTTPGTITSAPAATPTIDSKLDMILKLTQETRGEVRNLDARVRILEGKGPPPNMPPAPINGSTTPTSTVNPTLPQAKVVLSNKCAVCHQQGKEADGGGFVMLDATGNYAPFTAKQVASFTKHVNGLSMPPRSNKKGIQPLTDAEAYVLLNDISNIPTGGK